MSQYLLYGLLIYLAAINIVAFFLYGIDKWKAKRNKWRITEARLLWIAVAGGSIGALLGMKDRVNIGRDEIRQDIKNRRMRSHKKVVLTLILLRPPLR